MMTEKLKSYFSPLFLLQKLLLNIFKLHKNSLFGPKNDSQKSRFLCSYNFYEQKLKCQK